MAVIKRGILGGFQNKIGNVVGSSWKGIATMRALPISVANPRTSAQVLQRSRFSYASKYGSSLLSTIIKPLWDRFSQSQSGFNAWVKANLPMIDEDGAFQPPNLIMSQGTVYNPGISTSTKNNDARTITVTWSPDLEGDALPNDRVYIAVYNTIEQEFAGYASVAARGDGTVTISIANILRGNEAFQVYLMFRRVDGTRVSNSAWALTL